MVTVWVTVFISSQEMVTGVEMIVMKVRLNRSIYYIDCYVTDSLLGNIHNSTCSSLCVITAL